MRRPERSQAPVGQAAAHLPQATHFFLSNSRTGENVCAPAGQTCAHLPQPIQEEGSNKSSAAADCVSGL